MNKYQAPITNVDPLVTNHHTMYYQNTSSVFTRQFAMGTEGNWLAATFGAAGRRAAAHAKLCNRSLIDYSDIPLFNIIISNCEIFTKKPKSIYKEQNTFSHTRFQIDKSSQNC